jgi:hypothetical protein
VSRVPWLWQLRPCCKPDQPLLTVPLVHLGVAGTAMATRSPCAGGASSRM